MQITICKEAAPQEFRVAATPETVKKSVKLGAQVTVESGAGEGANISDKAYQEAGASIVSDRHSALRAADMILAVNKPTLSDVQSLKKNAIYASFLDPFNEKELVDALVKKGITALSMEMIPRSTRSQRMDALSSQANLAGYVLVLTAASHLSSILPMMMTPAGTIKPAKFFIIGAGVAGLQAIATAKRLGAQVTAFDTRPEVAEQVQSVGAKFLAIDLGETGSTASGYAQALTDAQLKKQQEAQEKVISQSDVVITTAQLFGRKPPVIVTRKAVEKMLPGSVVIDMAAENGGNVEGSKPGEVVTIKGVKVVGLGNWPNMVPAAASNVYANNLLALIEEFWNSEKSAIEVDLDNDIASCFITHGGKIVNKVIADLYGESKGSKPPPKPSTPSPSPSAKKAASSTAKVIVETKVTVETPKKSSPTKTANSVKKKSSPPKAAAPKKTTKKPSKKTTSQSSK